MNYLKQIIFELRERPFVTWITIIGTALSLFLLTALYISESISTAELSPESDRSLILSAPYVSIHQDKNQSTGGMSAGMAKYLYENIEGIETTTYYSSWMQERLVSIDGIDNRSYLEKKVDSDFWKVFDYDFLSGTPFTAAEIDASLKVVILSESVARELGKGADLTGRDILIDYIPYKVKGIIRDPNPILTNSWSQIWTAWKDTSSVNFDNIGETSVFLKMAPGIDPKAIKKEIKRRFEVYNLQKKYEGIRLDYFDQPYTVYEQTMLISSNQGPQSDENLNLKIILYAVLLLLPAINLSVMTRSRLQRRISEIGVRRAFGATRARIINQLIGENFVLTLLGGLLGLMASVIFTLLFSHLFVNYINTWNVTDIQANATPSFTMLFSWRIFFVALLACFILNIISTGIPAWKASRVNPSEAITGKHS